MSLPVRGKMLRIMTAMLAERILRYRQTHLANAQRLHTEPQKVTLSVHCRSVQGELA